MSDILLPNKLLIPPSRTKLVTRSRLTDRLQGGLHRTLTLISAPAGFGKTTLVADWAAGILLNQGGELEIQIAWLSVDESDNDFNRFLTYFLTTLLQLDLGIEMDGKAALEMFQSPNPAPIETILSPVLAALASLKKQIVIVLDDYHALKNLQIHKAIDFWLKSVTPQVHTVILSREDPPFPLARLRAQNQLLEFRSRDLRFTEAEATQFLNDVMGLELDPSAVTKLEQRTEGWIAGLQMAALSMRDRQDILTFIENFSGTNRFILDYLLEEVLANQPQEIQQFLLRTSILQQFTADLCDAVLEKESGSAAILKYLDRANLFLIPLDQERSWYRYHHLFSDLLTARLGQTHAEGEISELHKRAASWYEKKKMSFQAIYQASLIPDDAWVEQIIDQNYMEIFQRKESASIRQWTGELKPDLVFRRPQLAIHEANSQAWFGQLDDAEHLLDEAEKRLKEEDPTPETEAMHGYLSYVRSRVTAMRGDYQGAIELCRIAREKTPDSNQGLLGGIGVMLGYGYFLNGDFTQAAETLQETIQAGKRAGALNTTSGAYCVLARLYALQGQIQKAFDLYQEGEAFIQESAAERRGAMSIIDVGLAEIFYERNELEAASTHVQRGLKFISLWSKADDISLAYLIHSQIQQARGDALTAEQYIKKAGQVISSSGVFSEARDAVAAAEIQLWLKQRNIAAVKPWVKSISRKLESEQPFRFENEPVLIALAQAEIALGNLPEASELLEQLEAHAQSSGRQGRLLNILILQAVVRYENQELRQASSILERALILGEPEGYARTFLNAGQPMQQLLKHWLSQNKAHPVSSYARRLLDQLSALADSAQNGKKAPANQSVLIEELTERELEVLDLIAQGKTNKQIAAVLVISPGTVKAHTSNIYRKLDVSNRTEAVALARELEILL